MNWNIWYYYINIKENNCNIKTGLIIFLLILALGYIIAMIGDEDE